MQKLFKVEFREERTGVIHVRADNKEQAEERVLNGHDLVDFENANYDNETVTATEGAEEVE